MSLPAEFVEMIARCALVVHKWQPAARDAPTSSFTGSYSSHAKQAWLQGWDGMQGSSTRQAPYSPSWVGSPGGREGSDYGDSDTKRPPFHTIVLKDSLLDKELPIANAGHQERFEAMVCADARVIPCGRLCMLFRQNQRMQQYTA